MQCLSHAYPLTRHFLSDRWRDEINRENPLGTGGRLAAEYARPISWNWRRNDAQYAK